MADKWNLTQEQWSDVLTNEATPETIAKNLLKGDYLPWNEILLQKSEQGETTLDMGSGRGENSAMLARQGRRTTLLDWSQENIDYSKRLFQLMSLDGEFLRADMTKPLPFKDNTFDMVFSCGVFEYFTGETIHSILKEAFRVSRKRVVIMVPNALSIPYRLGMGYMKVTGQWHWGGEVPSYTLKPHFQSIPNTKVTEFSVGTRHSLDFLTMPGGGTLRRGCTKLFNLKDHSKPAFLRQGYLLITIAEKMG
ncbi:MAG: class I SAM-dependent methyltransferase [Nitrospirota bacterium]